MIIDSEGTDIDLGVEVLRGVQEGRMSGKETLFQRMSPPGFPRVPCRGTRGRCWLTSMEHP